MASNGGSLALEQQLLDKYKNYPSVYTTSTATATATGTSTAGRMFHGGRNADFLRSQILNDQNLQKKVFGLDGIPEEDDKSSIIWWWEPPADSTPKDFFNDSSMHGLKYLSQPKRHLCERIFWLVFFCTGVAAAAYLISGLWERYKANPVIVSFDPVDIDIGHITFPAVTICSMNKLRKNVVDKLRADYEEYHDLESGQDLYDAKVLCDAQRSFAKYFDFAYSRGMIDLPKQDHYHSSSNTNTNTNTRDKKVDNSVASKAFDEFIREYTIPCDQFIRLCKWAGESQNCSDLFTDVITEYGRCCTFNGLPGHMIEEGWNANTSVEKLEVKQWKEWSDILAPFILPEHWNYSNPYPKTQSRPGSLYGLSITLDADISNYFCPSSDSEGYRIMFHSPAELPPISEFGMSVGLGHEIYMKVIPEPIKAHDEIKGFDRSKRMCMLREEGNLDYYRHYTYSNCLDECVSEAIIEKCNCSFYYMKYKAKEKARLCDVNKGTADYMCSRKVRHEVSKDLRTACDNCDALCSDIVYRTETTMTKLQPADKLWEDFDTGKMNAAPEWTKNPISIVHIFYGDLSIVPKVRKALYGVTDIIANIGGLLGLCLGFSVLSAVEIVYFFTCRACLKRATRYGSEIPDAENGKHVGVQTGGQLRRMVFGFGRGDPSTVERVINLDPNALQMRANIY